jgi:hypothetical protein
MSEHWTLVQEEGAKAWESHLLPGVRLLAVVWLPFWIVDLESAVVANG